MLLPRATPELSIPAPIGNRLGARRAAIMIWLFEAGVLVTEAGLVAACGRVVAAILRTSEAPPSMPTPGAIAFAYAVLIVAGSASVRPPRRGRRAAALRILAAVFLVALLISDSILRALPWLMAWFVLASLAVTVWRGVVIQIARRSPTLMPPRRSMAFICNSEAAARMLDEIEGDKLARMQPVGFFDDRNRTGPLHGRLPFLGPIEELVEYMHDHDLQDVFVALPWSAGERIAAVIHRLRFLPLTVRLIPDQAPPALRQRNMHQMEGVVMPTLMRPPFSHAGVLAKRSFDLVVAGLLLIPLLPLFAVVAIAIRLDTSGPIFFQQVRSGQYGRRFKILKFRSLVAAESDFGAETAVSRTDRRVTRVGHYLRKYSIDELPQLFNVLFGEMSLVGPRPHAPRAKADGRIYAEVMTDYMLRYRVKPGMTGWAQVNGWRGNTDTEDKLRKRVEFDFDYIKRWSLWLDLRILFSTIPSVLMPPIDNF